MSITLEAKPLTGVAGGGSHARYFGAKHRAMMQASDKLRACNIV
jgi:hypothetical protein